jgi:hypothetical protein
MAGLLSWVPGTSWVAGNSKARQIAIKPVEVQNVDTSPDKRPRTLKHLLRANHTNHAIVYHNLQFDNHMAHILSSAYLLNASVSQLHEIYEEEAKVLEPWTDSPSEIIQDDWRDFLGNREYQRAYIDFFEDELAMSFSYDWKKLVANYMFEGESPLANCLIGGRKSSDVLLSKAWNTDSKAVGHPLIHLGYAFEMNSREIAIEALALTSVSYNYLHKYLDDPSYTRPSPLKSTSSPLELLTKAAADQRFEGLFKTPGFGNIDPLFEKHEALILEYWNAWDLPNPVKQFEDSQDAAIALLVATVKPGTHAYNFFIVHLLTTSHAVRILLPFMPAKFHVPVVRQWWLLTLAVYIAELRPSIDESNIPTDLKGKDWGYVEEKALTSKWRTDAHFVKGKW